MTKDEALQMCLEYIETDAHERKYVRHAIKEVLAKQEQGEPVSADDFFKMLADKNPSPFPTQQRKPLTHKQRGEIMKQWWHVNYVTVGNIIDAIEAAHGIKENT